MLVCENLSRRWVGRDGTATALDGVSMRLDRGTFTVLVGRSGCGKTTLLRLLAGLLPPSGGVIRPTDPDAPPPRIGFVFQEPRLMPWLDVAANVGFALAGRLPRDEVARRTRAALAMMGLSDVEDALPHRLSGGMASRVGLARALVSDPDLLLLDEPFAALDALTRRRLQIELVDLWTLRRPTVVFVTHDVEEAVLLADRIHRIDGGRIAETIDVALPRPRTATDHRVVALRARILAGLEAEPGRPSADAVPAASPSPSLPSPP
jgi:sulfonate transport system ATP-binding protein